MLPTTVDAIRAILRADPTVTIDERAWILAVVKSHGRKYRNDQKKALEKRVMPVKEVAARFGRSTRFVGMLADKGILHKVMLPGHSRSVGYFSEDVEKLLTPPEVPPDLRE